MVFLLIMIMIFFWMINDKNHSNGQSSKRLGMEDYILCNTWTTSIKGLHATDNRNLYLGFSVSTCPHGDSSNCGPHHQHKWHEWGKWSMVTIGNWARSLPTSSRNIQFPFGTAFTGEKQSLSQLPYNCRWNHTTFEDLQVEHVLPWKCLVTMAGILACNYWLWRKFLASHINQEEDCHHPIIDFSGIFKLFVIHLTGIYMLKIVLTSWPHSSLQGSFKNNCYQNQEKKRKMKKTTYL